MHRVTWNHVTYRGVVLSCLALLCAGASAPDACAQGVRGGADSVRVQLAGVERLSSAGSADAGSREDLFEVSVAIVHARNFHSWPDEPVVPPELEVLNPIATSIRVASAPAGVEVEVIEWPEPVVVTVRYTSEPLELLSFVDTTVARLRISLPEDLVDISGAAAQAEVKPLELQVQFQSCDEEYCYPPRRETLSVPLALDP
ncbi:MAG: protein-disulfide reductase DsbD N-terminal domain-containing protein [marine benthic group bacterium]|nr:protein-disulfide reductase DsbD N-terminal domain-containing protein [Gemmatimonadota bacterium]